MVVVLSSSLAPSLAAGMRPSCRVHCTTTARHPTCHLCRVQRSTSLCTAIPGPELLAMALLLAVVFSLLVSALVSAVFFSAIVRFLSEQVGHYLRRSCSTRRELLLARVASESRNHEAQNAETDDWEEIAAVATDGRVGIQADKQWEGIVGFFHPFWYGTTAVGELLMLTVCVAMLAAAANGSFGQPSERHRSAGPKLSA